MYHETVKIHRHDHLRHCGSVGVDSSLSKESWTRGGLRKLSEAPIVALAA